MPYMLVGLACLPTSGMTRSHAALPQARRIPPSAPVTCRILCEPLPTPSHGGGGSSRRGLIACNPDLCTQMWAEHRGRRSRALPNRRGDSSSSREGAQLLQWLNWAPQGFSFWFFVMPLVNEIGCMATLRSADYRANGPAVLKTMSVQGWEY